jgi:hypothetical protein
VQAATGLAQRQLLLLYAPSIAERNHDTIDAAVETSREDYLCYYCTALASEMQQVVNMWLHMSAERLHMSAGEAMSAYGPQQILSIACRA